MTKQAMAELVVHLERCGYVERVPDPTDRRAKLLRPTEAGQALMETAQATVPQLERLLVDLVGTTRSRHLRADLARIAGPGRDTISE